MAGKLYSKTTWVDEVLAGAAAYLLKDDAGDTVYEEASISLATGVITAGTAVTAATMQNIEDGIDSLDDLLVALQNKFTFDAATELTIVSGAVTAAQTVHKLQPETGTTDDLDTISGLSEGDILILYVSDAGTDTITIKHGTGNISCLGATDVALSHGSAIFYSDGTTVYLIGGGGGETVKSVCNGRLTLESGVPVSTSDQANKTTLYFTPYNGNEISLYDGTNWIRHEFTERSLALGALTASRPHDIFIYDNAGTLTLSATAWTDATTRATALTTQDGVYVKSGATNYRYLGTIYMDAASMCQDTDTRRFVWNLYNQVDKTLYVLEITSHTYNVSAWRAWNNNESAKVEFIVGLYQEILAEINAYIKTNTNDKDAIVGFLLDASNDSFSTKVRNGNTYGIQLSGGLKSVKIPGGYHYLIVTEYQIDVATGSYFECSLSGSIKQ